MARSKKTVVKDSLVQAEVNFEDMEDFRIAVPAINAEENNIIVTSNYLEVAAKIKALVAKYKGLELTEDNVNYVKTVKSHFVSLRTGIERERKDWQKLYLDPAKKTMQAMCDDLQRIVAEGENALAEQLDAYDQKRKDALTEIFTSYIEEAVEAYGLRSEYAERIELRKEFYNKTKSENEVIEDIESQAEALKKEQTEYDSAVELIKTECEGSTLVADTYIGQLKWKTPMELILQIKADKKRNAELMAEIKAKEEAGEPLVVGKKVEEGMFITPIKEKKEAGEMRTRKLVITYRSDLAEEIFDFFVEHGIKYQFVKE